MRIAVLDDYHHIAASLPGWATLGAEVAIFDKPLPQERLASTLAEFDVLVLMKVVVTTGMRNASVDDAYLREHGIAYYGTGIAGYGSKDPLGSAGAPEQPRGVPSTIEIAWALIFAVFKRVVTEDRAIRFGVWQEGLPQLLSGKTLGLLGLGRLGSAMVAPAKVFGLDVIAWSENLTPERAAQAGAVYVTKGELLERSDVISIHLVLSDRTRGLLGAAEFERMKRSAVLINTSRGPIADEQALVEALRSGTIAGAGLDVYDREPLPSDSQLPDLQNTVLLPHFGYVSEENLRDMWTQTIEDLAAHIAGSPIRVIQ
jgi:phosphoglycerate dehydrogenase-like enzyme